MINRSLTKFVLVIIGLIALFTCCACFGAERAMDAEGLYHAGCRIHNGGVAGSGCAIHQDENGDIYVASNYHVCGKEGNVCDLQFFSDGTCKHIEAPVVWCCYDNTKSIDVSILKIERQNAGVVKNYLPMWNSAHPISDEETVEFITVGAPKAHWLTEKKGRIKFDGIRNATFSVTPFGGQSGSGIAIKAKDGLYYWAALITWRTDAEGTETWGGLAQPACKIIDAMNGEVAEYIDILPVNANTVPSECSDAERGWGREVIIDGKPAWEVSGPALPDYEMQDWSIAGCDPCVKARTYWNPKIAQEGVKVTVHHGDGNERFVADSLGISNYPTYILYDDKDNEVKRWVGYYAENELDILNTIKKIKQDIADQKIKEMGEKEKHSSSQPEQQCDDETCRLFGNNQCQPQQKPSNNGSTNSGKFGLFDIPKSDVEPKEEPKQEPILPKLFPSVPKEEPKTQPKEDDNNGGLFNWKGKLNDELQNQKDKLENELEGKIKGLMMTSFWMMFLACTLAIACFGTIKQIAKCLWWGIKKVFSWVHDKIASFFSNGIKSAVAQIKETIDKQEEKATTKKSKE